MSNRNRSWWRPEFILVALTLFVLGCAKSDTSFNDHDCGPGQVRVGNACVFGCGPGQVKVGDACVFSGCPAGEVQLGEGCFVSTVATVTIPAAGGEVYPAGLVTVEAKAGAVPKDLDATISIYSRKTAPPKTGGYVAAAITFGPDGATFSKPLAVAVPLPQKLPVGTPLYVIPFTGSTPIVDGHPLTVDGGTKPRLAVVGPSGTHALFLQEHFSGAAIMAGFDWTASPATAVPSFQLTKRDIAGNALPGQKLELLLSNLTDTLFINGNNAPVLDIFGQLSKCNALWQGEGIGTTSIDDFECRKELYEEVLAQALLQVDAGDKTLLDDLLAQVEGGLGALSTVKDTAGNLVKAAVLTKPGAQAWRSHVLKWSKYATFKNVRKNVDKQFDDLDTALQGLSDLTDSVILTEELIRLMSYQMLFGGLLQDRIEAYDAHVAGLDNDLTRDTAYQAAWASVRAKLMAGINCNGGNLDAMLCFSNRISLYLQGFGSNGEPPALVGLMVKYGWKVAGKVGKWLVPKGAGLPAILLTAFEYSYDAFNKDVTAVVRDQMRRTLQGNAVARLDVTTLAHQDIVDDKVSLALEVDRQRYTMAQTNVFAMARFYAASARAISNADKSFFSQAAWTLFRETKLCLKLIQPPGAFYPMPTFLCPDTDVIDARVALTQSLDAWAAALDALHEQMTARLAECRPGECGCTSGVCDDQDPCTDDACAVDGSGIVCNHTPVLSPACSGADGGVGPGDAGTGGTDGGTPVYGSAGQSCAGGLDCGGVSCCQSIVVPGGSFPMGRSTSGTDAYPGADAIFVYELPEHTATVADFKLDTFEVTVGRFRKFVNAYTGAPPPAGAGAHPLISGSGWNPSWNGSLPTSHAALVTKIKNCPTSGQTWTDSPGTNENKPMICEAWLEAFAFCLWDGGRLPTEAEWEYAAAGGDENRLYPWGSTPPTCALTNFYGCGNQIINIGSTTGSGRWGHRDLAGNAWEFVLDAYSGYPASAVTNYANMTGGYHGMARGGDFFANAKLLRVAGRGGGSGSTFHGGIAGFRCAR